VFSFFQIIFFQQSGCTSQAQMCYSNLKARWSKEMLAMFEGFVLQGLVTPLLSKVVHPNKNNIYMSQMYIIAQRGRIVATILPFFPFWDSFFSLSLQNTQWNDRKTSPQSCSVI
jgi:hypothetical protein